MREIISIALKEINLIKTQKIALALILLYPIIVIGTLGLAFSGGTNSVGNINVVIYAPDNIQGFNTQDFLAKLEKSERLNLIKANSEEEVKEIIRKRQAKIGLIVHEPEPTNGKFVLDILNDNSNIVSSEFFFQAANDSVRRVGFETSSELLGDIWENLSQIKGDLKNETKRMDNFLQQLEDSEAQLIDLNNSVNEINIGEMREKLKSQEEVLDSTKEKIESFKKRVNSTNFDEELKQIRESKVKVNEAKSEFRNAKNTIIGACATYAPGQECIDLVPFEDVETELNDTSDQLDNAEAKLKDAQAQLTNASSELDEINTDFESANQDLNYFNAELSTLGKTIDKVNELITNSIETKKQVKADLEESKTLINSFITKLDDLQSLSPQFLSNPLIINKINIYTVKKLQIITPIALTLVLMLTAILLTAVSFVTERNQGAYSRLLLSTTSKTGIFIGKILGQLAFALLESLIIILLAVFLFNIDFGGVNVQGFLIHAGNCALSLGGNCTGVMDEFIVLTAIFIQLQIVLSAISVSFIAIGLFISNYTKIQSTSVLAGLLLVIPMIFISGIIIPIELMSQPIQEVSGQAPLTIGVVLATEVIIKGTPIIELLGELATLIVPAILFIAYTIFNRNL
ncbi:MAG: hypothetical protein COV47_02110 [Candidatus Diapherotrites archaeon CG11_big_fil_rev_8_21_14_0_20_37_9]|nr:MAG: hypothetical protein COV47_02110 [Candidatus Diapherotrites archaeon CG11_big_fil_rev_8_21_14_0_20_37_9]